jgi:hypothetical protein
MYKILLGALVLTFVIIMLLFFFVQLSTNINKNARQIGSDLERIQNPLYTPMGIVNAIVKFFLSIFT